MVIGNQIFEQRMLVIHRIGTQDLIPEQKESHAASNALPMIDSACVCMVTIAPLTCGLLERAKYRLMTLHIQ